MAERLQRYLARSGIASRRHAEELITAGRVTVNNETITTLGSKVEANDLVALDGKLVMPPDTVSWYMLYKPSGVVTTLDDPQGRPTILGFLGSIRTRVFPIGRLDWDAEGALLLTDDGAAAHRLLHPSFQVPRTYLAKVKGAPTDEGLARLTAGVRLEDGPARALEVERFQSAERNTWLRVVVGEGRPHLVKRLCAAIGHPVVRLFRPHQAGVSVHGMQPGEIRPLKPEELAIIEAVAAGQPVPRMTLSLPARRHGRADADEEEGLDGEAPPPRAPKPPRFGTREWRNASPGSSGPRGAASGGKDTARPEGHRRPSERSASRPERPASSGPTEGAAQGGFATGPWDGGGNSPVARRSFPRARFGAEGAPPPRGENARPTRSEAGRQHDTEKPERTDGRDSRRGPPKGRPAFERAQPSRSGHSFAPRSGGGASGKRNEGRGAPFGARRGAPEGRPAFAPREGQPRGAAPRRNRDIEGSGPGRGGFSAERRGASPGRGGFEERKAPGRGGPFKPRQQGGRDFGPKAGEGRGGFSGAPRGAAGSRPGFQKRRPAGRGAGGPPSERGSGDFRGPPGARRGAGDRRGPPGAPSGFKPSGPRRGSSTGGGARSSFGRPPPSGRTRPEGRPSPGGPGHRPSEGRRGPPRPRSGPPKGPRR